MLINTQKHQKQQHQGIVIPVSQYKCLIFKLLTLCVLLFLFFYRFLRRFLHECRKISKGFRSFCSSLLGYQTSYFLVFFVSFRLSAFGLKICNYLIFRNITPIFVGCINGICSYNTQFLAC